LFEIILTERARKGRKTGQGKKRQIYFPLFSVFLLLAINLPHMIDII